MNYSINSKKLQSQHNQFNPAGLTLAAYLTLQRLNRSKYQLEHIAGGHPMANICQEANTFLLKNKKLISITVDLISRLNAFSKSFGLETIATDRDDTLIQLKMELDILDDMHFEVAKSYTAFIYENYEATIITMANTTKEDQQGTLAG